MGLLEARLGPNWDHVEAKMGKERKEAIYRAQERKQMILEWTVGIALATVASTVIGLIIYLIGVSQGAW